MAIPLSLRQSSMRDFKYYRYPIAQSCESHHRAPLGSPLVKELIVFNSFTLYSVSIMIYGHFAVAEPKFPEGLKYLSLSDRPSLFFYCLRWCEHVQSVSFHSGCLLRFRSDSLTRIKDAAVEQLPRPFENNIGLSLAATDMFLDEMSQTHSMTPREWLQGDSAVRKPSDTASNPRKQEMVRIRERVTRGR